MNDFYTYSSVSTKHTTARAAEIDTLGQTVETAFDKLPDERVLNEDRVTFGPSDTGAADVYAIALPQTLVGYVAGLRVRFAAANANTGPSTLNVDGLGVKAITRWDGSDLQADDILAGQIVDLTYNGTDFRFTAPPGGEAIAAAASATAAGISASAASSSATSASDSASAALSSASAAALSAANLPNASTAGASKFIKSNSAGTGWDYSTAVIGGEAANSPLILRSTSGVGTSDDIIFQVGNNGATEAGRFTNAGDMGIGTAAPGSLFEVYGGAARFSLGGFGNIPGVQLIEDADSPAIRLYDPTGGSPNANVWQLRCTADLTFGYENADRYSESALAAKVTFKSDGKVGIGTAAPGAQLEVSGLLDSNIIIASDSDSNGSNHDAGVQFFNNGSKKWSIRNDESGTGAADSLVIQLGISTEKFIIDSGGDFYLLSGNVGINESAPDYKLDVNGSFGFTPGTSVTPVDNGDVTIYTPNNTTMTFAHKGSDGTVRSAILGLSTVPTLDTATIVFVIDGGGAAPATGEWGGLPIDFACTINSVRMAADASGSAVIDIWKSTYAALPAADGDSITASAVPTLSTAQFSEDVTLTGWTTAVTAGDWLWFNLDSVTTCTRITITLKVTKV